MDIRVIDRSRHVTQVPSEIEYRFLTEGDVSPTSVLDRLLVGQAVHTGQIEFECDQAFADLLRGDDERLQTLSKGHPDFRSGYEPKPDDDPTSAVALYKGVRIFVVGEAGMRHSAITQPEPAPVPEQTYHTVKDSPPRSNVLDGVDPNAKITGTDHALPPLPKAKP